MSIKRLKNSSIKIKLIFYHSFIVLLSLCVFALLIVFQSSIVVKKLAQKNVEGVILNTQSNISTLMNNINECMLSFQINNNAQQILSTGQSTSIADDIHTLERELLSVDPFHTKISAFELYSFKHTDFPGYNPHQSVFSGADLQSDVLFSQMVNSGYKTQWFIQDSITDNNSFIVASKLICGINMHEPIALLKAKISLKTFTSLVDRISLAETGKIFYVQKRI